MSSREIAEQTGKRHGNVIRDIRQMLDDLGEVVLKFEFYYTASNGKRNLEFLLPKDLTLTILQAIGSVEYQQKAAIRTDAAKAHFVRSAAVLRQRSSTAQRMAGSAGCAAASIRQVEVSVGEFSNAGRGPTKTIPLAPARIGKPSPKEIALRGVSE